MNVVSVKAQELLVISDPQAQVAADPGRLAVWKANASSDIADYGPLAAIRLRGCGIDETYLCWHEISSSGEEIDYFCNEIDLSDSNSKLETFAMKWDVMQALRGQLGISGPSQ